MNPILLFVLAIGVALLAERLIRWVKRPVGRHGRTFRIPRTRGSYPNPTAEDMRVALDFLNSQHRIECSWCKKVLQYGREPVSHGICDQCSKVHFGIDLASVRKQEGVR